MGSPDEPRLTRIVAKRLTNLGDEAGEIGFRDKRCGPQKLVQLVLRERAWSTIHQNSQKLEGLRREMDLSIRTDKLPGIRVERQFAKTKFHRLPSESHNNAQKSPGTTGVNAPY